MRWIFIFLSSFLIFVSAVVSQSLTKPVSGVSVAELNSQASVPMKAPNETSAHQSLAKSSTPNENRYFIFLIFVPIIAVLIGVLAGAVINIYLTRRQSTKELMSLILAFASELTLAFERCVMYYEQARKGQVSFSELFDFTDASILSRFATVNTQPEVLAAIIDLKSTYFQIGRHVEDAARFAAEANRLAKGKSKKAGKLMEAARHAQGTALAFFLGSDERYEKTVKETEIILDAAKKISPGKVAQDLENKFADARAKKADLDATKLVQKKREEQQNKS